MNSELEIIIDEFSEKIKHKRIVGSRYFCTEDHILNIARLLYDDWHLWVRYTLWGDGMGGTGYNIVMYINGDKDKKYKPWKMKLSKKYLIYFINYAKKDYLEFYPPIKKTDMGWSVDAKFKF